MSIVKLFCQKCSNKFEVSFSKRNQKYCSKECYHKSSTKGRPPTKKRKKCIICQKDISLKNKRFCSIKCKNIYWTGRERNMQKFIPDEKICPTCNKVFLVGGRGNKKRKRTYCSNKCSGIGQRKNIKDSQVPTRSRMWQRLREEIFSDRGVKCEFCNNIDHKERIQLHHIIPNKINENYDKDNLMLLCLKCHAIIEHLTKIGYNNKNKFNPKHMIRILGEEIYD